MRLFIEIPEEFEEYFQTDRFVTFMHWITEDAEANEDIRGMEFIDMFKDAFMNAVSIQGADNCLHRLPCGLCMYLKTLCPLGNVGTVGAKGNEGNCQANKEGE